VLAIVQRIIDNEVAADRKPVGEGSRGSTKQELQIMDSRASDLPEQKEKASDVTGQQTFLYKEEFKLIMQLIFTLSEYDLKNASAEKPSA
jgi:hypothetical protein